MERWHLQFPSIIYDVYKSLQVYNEHHILLYRLQTVTSASCLKIFCWLESNKAVGQNCQTAVTMRDTYHDHITTIANNFLLTSVIPECPQSVSVLHYYIYRWVILYIGRCWTWHVGLSASLVKNPPRGPIMFPLCTEVLHSSLPQNTEDLVGRR